MRTEINITDFAGGAYLKVSTAQPLTIDAVNGMRLPVDYKGLSGFLVTVRNTGTRQKSITVLQTASHLGATPAVITILAGETVLLAGIDGQRHGACGGVDFDFEAGFKGEIAAFRLPGKR